MVHACIARPDISSFSFNTPFFKRSIEKLAREIKTRFRVIRLGLQIVKLEIQ